MARALSYRRAAAAALFAAAVVYTIAFVLVLVVSQLDEREPADVIVVLGAAQYNGRPSPVLRARLDHALELWREGLAPAIVVTGGVGRGDKESEAIVGRRYLLAHDVPDTVLVVQPQGRSTQASMTAVAAWLGVQGRRRALLVSDPFHMLRLRLEARRTGLDAQTSPTDSSPISDNPALELRFLAIEALKIPIAYVKSLSWFR
jgi:uncharacterized SAM-binding protein YcdF (DUF218 family)